MTVQNQAKKSWFSMRKGILFVIMAPLIFILSGLFLANTLVNPPESLAYRIGQVICLVLAPAVFVLGIVTCIKAHINKRAVGGKLPPEVREELPPEPAVEKEPRKEKRKKRMPRWLARMRRALAISLFIWCATVTILGGPAGVIFGIGPQVLIVLIVAAYAFSERRGAFGTAMITLLSASVFATLIAVPLVLLFGCIPLGIPELVGDWMAGRDPGAVRTILFVVKAGLLLSTGLAVLASFLLEHKPLRKFKARRITKVLTVCIVLLPIAVMCLVPTDEGPVVPSMWHPCGYGFSGPHALWTDFNTTRVYENGQWIYTVYLYNRGPESTTITRIWVWHDLVEPLSARVTVNGTGTSLSEEGILFEPGASGTLTIITAQGHNKVTILYQDGESVTTVSWRTSPIP